MHNNREEQPSVNQVAECASELGFMVPKDRLEALAREPSMQAQLALIALHRRITELNDPQAQQLMSNLYTPAYRTLGGDLYAKGYTLTEQSALMLATHTLEKQSASGA